VYTRPDPPSTHGPVRVARRDIQRRGRAGGGAQLQVRHGAGAHAQRRHAGVPFPGDDGRARAGGRLRRRPGRRLAPVRRGRDGLRGPGPAGGAPRGAAARGADLLRAPGRRAPPRPAARGGRRARRPGLGRALLPGLRIRLRRAGTAEARRRRAPRLRAAARGRGARAAQDDGLGGGAGAAARAPRRQAPRAVRVGPHRDPRVSRRVGLRRTGTDSLPLNWLWLELEAEDEDEDAGTDRGNSKQAPSDSHLHIIEGRP
jgi:hypothetical protein